MRKCIVLRSKFVASDGWDVYNKNKYIILFVFGCEKQWGFISAGSYKALCHNINRTPLQYFHLDKKQPDPFKEDMRQYILNELL